MKTFRNHLTARRLRPNFVINSACVLLLALLLNAPAPAGTRIAPAPDTLSAADNPPSPRLSVVVYQVQATAQVKVQFTHDVTSPVKLRLKNDQGDLLYQEVITRPTYIRKFDLSALPDACYYLELHTRGEHLVKQIVIQTRISRNLVIR